MLNKFEPQNRNTIYIQPLEAIDDKFLELLKSFCQIYYLGAQVQIKKVLDIKKL